MKNKKVQEANFDIKKWVIFVLFLSVLIGGFYFLFKPKGENEAQQAIRQAKFYVKMAGELAQDSGKPEDLANYDLAKDALERANKFNIESDFNAATAEAQRSAGYAQKVIRTSRSGRSNANIRFEEVVGEVFVKNKNQVDFQVANKDMGLDEGSVLRTSLQGACRISFEDGMNLTVRPGSVLALETNLEKGDDTYGLALSLEKGTVVIKTSQTGAAKVHVLSEHGRTVLYQNTHAAIAVNTSSEKSVEVRVLAGRADARSGPKSVRVSQNQRVSFSTKLFNKNTVTLPQQPILTSPTPFAKFPVNQNGFASVALRWDAPRDTSKFHLELSNDALFVKMIRDQTRVTGTRQDFQALSPGVYFWRVASTSTTNIEGFPSDSRRFEVVQAEGKVDSGSQKTAPPHLEIGTPLIQGLVAIVKGRTARDATVKVNGEIAIVSKENGSFSHVIHFPGKGLYQIMVIAESSTGRLATKEIKIEIKD